MANFELFFVNLQNESYFSFNIAHHTPAYLIMSKAKVFNNKSVKLKDAIAEYDIDSYKTIIKPLEELRQDFIRRFSINNIHSIKKDEYVQGKGEKN